MPVGSPAPWSYVLIRFLFKFVLKVFYGTIVVENAEFIPPTGSPCIVCANHSNSLTDALLLVASIPSKQRNMLRLTAKATQFGHKTFTSWLIESAGTVPIQRRKDYVEGEIDNSDAMLKLMEALETGDAVCMFPEGMSRYHPTIAPLKTGVARLVSDVLSRNRDQPDFEISVLTCSITYMHRQHWRSDVLVTFHKPIIFTPTTHPQLLSPVNFNDIRTITNEIEKRIISGTFSAPSWDLIRISKLASRMYAPLGTQMTLGDHVQITRAFLQAFKAADQVDEYKQDTVTTDLRQLRDDLRLYQDELAHCGIKDDRIRRPLRRRVIATRFFVRLFWGSALLTLSLPGLLFWFPIFITTFYAVHNFKKTGPIFDTWDEIAQYKLIYGLFSGLCVWLGTVMLTWPIAFISLPGVPALMWMSLRWMEDAVAALRACAALARLMAVGRLPLQRMGEQRRNLYSQVLDIGVNVLNLPEEPEKYFLVAGGAEKGRARGRWQSGAKYFSLRRRRKRDWNETLRLYDKVDYPQEE